MVFLVVGRAVVVVDEELGGFADVGDWFDCGLTGLGGGGGGAGNCGAWGTREDGGLGGGVGESPTFLGGGVGAVTESIRGGSFGVVGTAAVAAFVVVVIGFFVVGCSVVVDSLSFDLKKPLIPLKKPFFFVVVSGASVVVVVEVRPTGGKGLKSDSE